MGTSNRRDFLKNAAIGGTAVGAGFAAAGISPQRVFSEETSKHELRFRNLGSTGYKVTEIGFGAMNMRDPELVHAAVDAGINYIDTAHGYMNGENERVIGQVMKTKRDKVFLTTKIGSRNPDDMPDMLETSLKRLQTDHVDLLLLHNVGNSEQILADNFLNFSMMQGRRGIPALLVFQLIIFRTKFLMLQWKAISGKLFWFHIIISHLRVCQHQ